ncbi:MAG: tetratricopeptide repeat protein [Planctomycetota bacterium]|jgi:tetratricopeptide (TPR) repeat protein
MARKKHTKREPDVFQRALMGAFEQISGAGGILALILVAALVTLAVLWGVSTTREQGRAEAWKQLAKAMEAPGQADQIEALEELLTEAAGTPVQPTALLLLAAAKHEKAMFDPTVSTGRREKLLGEVRKLYGEFLDDNSDHPLAIKAQANLAKVMEDAGDHKAAYDAFGRAAQACQDSDFSFLQGEMLWGQARCAREAGNDDEALSLLESAMTRGFISEGGGWKSAARQMHDELRKAKKNLLVKGATPDEPPAEKPEPPKGTEKPGGPPKKG